MNFELILQRLKDNNKLDAEVARLVQYSLTHKKLQYSENENNEIDIDYLLANNILIKQGDSYKIIDNKIVAYKLFYIYKERGEFELSDNFKATFDFILSLKNSLTSNSNIGGFINLRKGLYEVAIYESNMKHNVKLSSFISSFNKEGENDDNYIFIESYSKTLPSLNQSVEEVFLNCKLLLNYTYAEVTYNAPAENVLNGLYNWCLSDLHEGCKLFLYTINQEIDIATENIISCLTIGLSNEYYKSIIKPLLFNQFFAKEILHGLSRIKNMGDHDVKEFIEVFDFYNGDNLLQPQLISLLVCCFNYEKISEAQSDKIFSRLNNLLLDTESKYKKHLINSVSRISDNEYRKKDLLINFITSSDFSFKEDIELVANCFYFIKAGDILKAVLLSIADVHPHKSIAKYFESPIKTFDASELDKVLIDLITDNKASNRYIGLDIFKRLSLQSCYVFTFDILRLSALRQYKLWVGLTQAIAEPKYIIPSILPLLKSTSEIVQESLICKIEEYTEEYGEHVISVLKTHLRNDNKEDSLIIERITEYMTKYYSKNMEMKNDIRELNPYYSHNRLFKSFHQIFRRDFSKKLSKSVDENSFMKLFGKSIKLAKGGGWKVGDKISKLGSVETGMALPRSYFIFPNRYEYEESKRMLTDWQDQDFLDIENCINNEQQ